MAELPAQVKKIISMIEKESGYVDTIRDFRKMKRGFLYLLVYDAKWKAELWAWDALPIFVLIDIKGDRMFGWNLHYLPFVLRVNVCRQLMKMTSWKKRLQYRDVVKAWKAAKAPIGFLHLCFRTYLFSHIRSEIKEFHSQNFEDAIQDVMPKFKKKTEEEVYKIILSKFYKHAGGIKGVTWDKKKKKK
jgi:hypothetical protein